MTGRPPSSAGGAQVSAAEPSPRVALTAGGAPGEGMPPARVVGSLATWTSSKCVVSAASFQSWTVCRFVVRLKSALIPQLGWVWPLMYRRAGPATLAEYRTSTSIQVFAGAEPAGVSISRLPEERYGKSEKRLFVASYHSS